MALPTGRAGVLGCQLPAGDAGVQQGRRASRHCRPQPVATRRGTIRTHHVTLWPCLRLHTPCRPRPRLPVPPASSVAALLPFRRLLASLPRRPRRDRATILCWEVPRGVSRPEACPVRALHARHNPTRRSPGLGRVDGHCAHDAPPRGIPEHLLPSRPHGPRVSLSACSRARMLCAGWRWRRLHDSIMMWGPLPLWTQLRVSKRQRRGQLGINLLAHGLILLGQPQRRVAC
jgi:hypothetical protein